MPVPLVRDKSTLPDFPLEVLPTIPCEMVRGISRTTFTNPAMPATEILSVLSYCFNGIYRMEGKTDHIESEKTVSISKRDLLRLCRRFKSNEELNKTLQILLDYNYLREEIPPKKSPGRKPRTTLSLKKQSTKHALV